MAIPPLGAHVSTAGGAALAFERGRALACECAADLRQEPQPVEGQAARAARGRGLPRRPRGERRPAGRRARGLPDQPRGARADDPRALARRPRRRARALRSARRARARGASGRASRRRRGRGHCRDRGVARRGPLQPPRRLPTRILLELTAGQGSVLGSKLEELAEMRSRAACAERVGYCLDTCHAFAAGWEMGTAAGVEQFLADVDRVLGLRARRVRPPQRLGGRARLAQGPARQSRRGEDRDRPASGACSKSRAWRACR